MAGTMRALLQCFTWNLATSSSSCQYPRRWQKAATIPAKPDARSFREFSALSGSPNMASTSLGLRSCSDESRCVTVRSSRAIVRIQTSVT